MLIWSANGTNTSLGMHTQQGLAILLSVILFDIQCNYHT